MNNLYNISVEDLKNQLDNAKKTYEKNLFETEKLLKENNIKDNVITELTNELKKLLELESELESTKGYTNYINTINNNNINNNNNNIQIKKADEEKTQKIINELKLELINMKNEQNSIIKEIEKEYEKDFQLKINKLKDSYERKYTEINSNQNKKIFDLQLDIKSIKNKIDKYEKAFLSKNNYSSNINNLNSNLNLNLNSYTNSNSKLNTLNTNSNSKSNSKKNLIKNKNIYRINKNEEENFINFPNDYIINLKKVKNIS